MLRKQHLLNKTKIISIFVLLLLVFFNGCAPSGLVIDRDQFETSVKRMSLKDYPFIKICHGGILSEIPLCQIRIMKIDPSSSIVFENELYYRAELTFKNGTKVQSTKDKSKNSTAFVSIQNTISGKSKDQTFSISLDNVSQIQIKK